MHYTSKKTITNIQLNVSNFDQMMYFQLILLNRVYLVIKYYNPNLTLTIPKNNGKGCLKHLVLESYL
jgi:hypothetical protein